MDDIIFLKTLSYEQYLTTEHWATVREERLIFAKHKCEICNSNDDLQVHHRTYDNIGNEQLTDLIALCKTCHKLYHKQH